MLKYYLKGYEYMETRQITEVHIYVLVLNTVGAAESCEIAAVSDDYQKLVDFYNSQLLPVNERFRNNVGFFRSFKEGPLYDLNPCNSLELNDTSQFRHGIHDEWVNANNLDWIRNQYYCIDI